MQLVVVVVYDCFYCLGQWIVNIGQCVLVVDVVGEDYYVDCQYCQCQNVVVQGVGNGVLWIFGFFGCYGGFFNGEEELDGEWNGGEYFWQCQVVEVVCVCLVVSGEVVSGEVGGDYVYEYQQFEDGQQSDDQFEGGGDVDVENIECYKDYVGVVGDLFWIQCWKLYVEVGFDGYGDGWWGEDEFNQGGKISDKVVGGFEGVVGIGERVVSVWDGGGQFGKVENKGVVYGGDCQGDDYKFYCVCL